MAKVIRGVSVVGCLAFTTWLGCEASKDPTFERRSGALSAPQTVSFQSGTNGYTGASDTRISQNAATTNYGASTALGVDGDDPSGTGRDVSALLRWDVSSIPSGSTIQSATITLRVTDASTNSYPFLALARAWSESAATWQQAAAGQPWEIAGATGPADREATPLASLTASATGSHTVTLSASGIAKVQQWVDNPAQNFGIIVASTSNTNGLDFASRETATVANRPRLTITFVAPEPPDAGTDTPQIIDAGSDTPQAVDTGSEGAGGGGQSGGGGGGGGGQSGAAGDTGSAGTVGTDVDAGGTGGTAGQDAGAPDAPADTGSSAGGGGPAGSGGGAAGEGGTTGTGGAGGPGGGGSGGGAGGAGTGGTGPVTVYAAGDIGHCSSTGDTATGNLLDGLLGPVLVLGDIAYQNGSATDFANCFDPPWGRHKGRIYPTPGNHEYQTLDAAGYFGYFGAAAGEPSKGYYSFDLGAWHVVALNSGKCSMNPPPAGGCIDAAQEQWLRADLASNPRPCTLAFWHHPRFSSGNHGNLTAVTPLWQALMDHGADVVLTGHDHNYQRWVAQDASGNAVPTGLVQFVVGTGGASRTSFRTTQPANTAKRSSSSNGVLKLTLRDTGYDWQYLKVAGSTSTFTDAGSANCH
jgi:hypothetical protein